MYQNANEWLGRVAPWVGLAAILVAVAPGCGGGSPFGIVPVSGKVTYEDGSLIPAERIRVTFVPQAKPIDPKTYPSPGTAEVDVKTGEFKTMSTGAVYGNGATVGRNKVQIQALNGDETPSKAIPAVYADPAQTPIPEIEVASGSPPFEFKIKKP
jgi:hypothetical protein